jgi:glycopeptide antibiotics resistance protein
MPLPFFTVCLFKRINRWYSVLAVTLTSVLLIELLQLLLLTGSSDIDDVILNVSGAMLFYALLRIPAVSRFLTRFTMDVWQ